jgi:hypothetical protein
MDATVIQSTSRESNVAKLVLRQAQLAKFRRQHGDRLNSDRKFAAAIGIHPGQVSRVLAGTHPPGTKFIVGCLELFGGADVFPDLFAIEPDEDVA